MIGNSSVMLVCATIHRSRDVINVSSFDAN